MKAAAATPAVGMRVTSKKIFYQDEIRKLIQRDPNRYALLKPAIEQAYKEDRVKPTRGL